MTWINRAFTQDVHLYAFLAAFMVETPVLPDLLTVQEAFAATAAFSARHNTTCHKISTPDLWISSNGCADSQTNVMQRLTAEIILACVWGCWVEFGHDDMIDAETSAKPWSWEHLRLSLLRKMKPVAWLSKSSLQQLPGTSKALESFKLKQAVCKQQHAEQACDYKSNAVRTERRFLYFAINCNCVLWLLPE